VTWTVRFTAAAERQAEALDPPIRRRIANRLARLAADPRNAANVKTLKGSDRYRHRFGRYRPLVDRLRLEPGCRTHSLFRQSSRP
jgi:mRNA-degrading endonuclease RelE of RelBE toxin-antitoxin system